jgi:putative membrane protein
MHIAALIAVSVDALIHVYILVLEMILRTTPRGRRAYATTQDYARASKVLAANQGLYNGFLAAGLLFGLLLGGAGGRVFQGFFLVCVIIAGLYGAATANRRILFIQALPAAIALALVLLDH